MKKVHQRTVLVILDGWGISPQKEGNAFLQAKIPSFCNLVQNYPSGLISASSESVGLTSGEMGNSEVGHLNIGSGRVIWHELALISQSIENNTFFKKSANFSFTNM